MEEFQAQYEDLRENKSLCAHYHTLYGELLLRKARTRDGEPRIQLRIQAREYMEKSLKL